MNYQQHKIYAELAIWIVALGLALLMQSPQTTFAYISFGYFTALGLWGLKQHERQLTSVLYKFFGTAVYLMFAPLLAPFLIGANLSTYIALSACAVLATFFSAVVAVIYDDKIKRLEKACQHTPKDMGDSIFHD